MAKKESTDAAPKATRLSAVARLAAQLAEAQVKEQAVAQTKLVAAKAELEKAGVSLDKAMARVDNAKAEVDKFNTILGIEDEDAAEPEAIVKNTEEV